MSEDLTMMEAKTIRNGLLILTAWLLGGAIGLSADFKTAELQRKAEEIASLQITVSDKVDQAVGMRRQLDELMRQYAEEIRYEKSRWRYSTFRNAVGNPRIAYDLELVQQLQAYIAILDQRIGYFRQAGQVLEFYFRQINDDLLMIRTLDDFAVDQVIAKINDALDEYVPATIRKTVQIDKLQFEETEIIWQEIMRPQKDS
jgi:hypothetical protein